MPGFKTNNTIDSKDTAPKAVFVLKSSTGREIRTYTVPMENVEAFKSGMQAEELKLRAEAGETDKLILFQVERCF